MTEPTDATPAAPRTEASPPERSALALAAGDALLRVHGPQLLQAAVLALLLPAGSKRARRAWQFETAMSGSAAAMRVHVLHLPASARLPWLETLVRRLGGQPLEVRKDLLAATRRVMGARGTIRPIDRLHWLAMRQWLGEGSAAQQREAAAEDLSRLPQGEVSAIASYSAFLSRLVPIDASEGAAETAVSSEGDAPATAGERWYEEVMAPWRPHADVPACRPPDTDGLVHALHDLQAMAWMQRPMLVRRWVSAAQQHAADAGPGTLDATAADALRLSCTLLDSPLPPALAQHFGPPPAP